MRQGYTIVSSGWDATVAPGGGRHTITVPVAKNPDGSLDRRPRARRIRHRQRNDDDGTLTYPAATLDKSQASLTVRVHYTDPPISIPATGWEYVNDRTIRLLPAGDTVQAGQTLRVHLSREGSHRRRASDFAAIRDLAAFLHHAATDSDGNPNPLAGDVQFVYSFCISQPCRFMHDFLHLGLQRGRGRASGSSTGSSTGAAARAEASSTIASRSPHEPTGSTSVAGIQSASSPSPTRSSSTRHWEDRRRLRRCRADQHVPEDLRDQLGERVLGQGRLTPAHGHPRERSPRSHERPVLPALEPSARRSERARHLPAAQEPARSQSRLARAPGGAGPVGLRGQDATSKPCAAARGWHAGSLAAETGRVSPHPRGHVQRAHDHWRPVRFRALVR